MHTILIVDDDIQMLELVGQLLEREGYVVRTAESAVKALGMVETEPPNLFLIDLYLPDIDGLELCQRLRENPATAGLPVVFISGHEASYTVADALQAGGDDFIQKPFAVRELTARLRAHLRRLSLRAVEESIPTLRIYPEERRVLVDDRPVDLTQVEYELLSYLCVNPARLHSTQELLTNVWNYPPDAGDAALVRNHIRNLRRKLEDSPEHPEIIQSRHGRGYTIKAQVVFTGEAQQML